MPPLKATERRASPRRSFCIAKQKAPLAGGAEFEETSIGRWHFTLIRGLVKRAPRRPAEASTYRAGIDAPPDRRENEPNAGNRVILP